MGRSIFNACFSACVAVQLFSAHAQAGAVVDVEVVSRGGGHVAESYSHGGKTWIAGDPGNAYSIRLRNKSGGRVLTVLSVDGVNAISGESASARQSGYVLEPWGTAEIRGWRKSLDDVAQFYFTPIRDSYAARTGRPEHVGVIGVAVFRELQEPRPALEMRPRMNVPGPAASPAEAAAGEPALDESPRAARSSEFDGTLTRRGDVARERRLGTGHGTREHDPARHTEFRRATESPAETVRLYYDSNANLVARGIIPRTPHFSRPEPFPRDEPRNFVPDPRG